MGKQMLKILEVLKDKERGLKQTDIILEAEGLKIFTKRRRIIARIPECSGGVEYVSLEKAQETADRLLTQAQKHYPNAIVEISRKREGFPNVSVSIYEDEGVEYEPKDIHRLASAIMGKALSQKTCPVNSWWMPFVWSCQPESLSLLFPKGISLSRTQVTLGDLR
jgi:hypothetical protein